MLVAAGCRDNSSPPIVPAASPVAPAASAPLAALSCDRPTVSIYEEGPNYTFCRLALDGVDATLDAQWTTSNAAVATVSQGYGGYLGNKAEVTGAAVGSAKISASVRGVTAVQSITVNDNFPLNLAYSSGATPPTAGPVTAAAGASVLFYVHNGGTVAIHPMLLMDWGDGQFTSFPAGTAGNGGCYMIDQCVYFRHVYSTPGVYVAAVTAAVSSPPTVRTSVTITP